MACASSRARSRRHSRRLPRRHASWPRATPRSSWPCASPVRASRAIRTLRSRHAPRSCQSTWSRRSWSGCNSSRRYPTARWTFASASPWRRRSSRSSQRRRAKLWTPWASGATCRRRGCSGRAPRGRAMATGPWAWSWTIGWPAIPRPGRVTRLPTCCPTGESWRCGPWATFRTCAASSSWAPSTTLRTTPTRAPSWASASSSSGSCTF
mmetsp:Transcript_6818/g.18901  ORF Transcript_6818/g.18901 Transcript_6818/m.18901 type:complete len:209 (-) Transcript_6818:1257-1883(-)